jgi:hypothetical protein
MPARKNYKIPWYIRSLARHKRYLIIFDLEGNDFCDLIERINDQSFNRKTKKVSGPEELGEYTAYVYWSKNIR